MQKYVQKRVDERGHEAVDALAQKRQKDVIAADKPR